MKRCYEFGPDQVETIDRLARELSIDKTDVLTSGLRLLRMAVREARHGNAIGIIQGQQVLREIDGAWSEVGQVPAA